MLRSITLLVEIEFGEIEIGARVFQRGFAVLQTCVELEENVRAQLFFKLESEEGGAKSGRRVCIYRRVVFLRFEFRVQIVDLVFGRTKIDAGDENARIQR